MSETLSFDQQVGNIIRRKRIQHQKSMEELADLAKLSAAHLGKIERGEKLPNMYTYFKLCVALDIKDELFDEIIKERNSNNK